MDGTHGSLRVGSRVKLKVPSGHPEDPVGVVMMFLADNPQPGERGGVLAQFTSAGAEVHAESDLEIVAEVEQ
jgi:hypothetical protein